MIGFFPINRELFGPQKSQDFQAAKVMGSRDPWLKVTPTNMKGKEFRIAMRLPKGTTFHGSHREILKHASPKSCKHALVFCILLLIPL